MADVLAVTKDEVNTALVACANAIRAKDFATARIEYAVASALLLGVPEETRKDDYVMRYRAELTRLEGIIDAAERASTRSSGPGRTAIGRVRYG